MSSPNMLFNLYKNKSYRNNLIQLLAKFTNSLPKETIKKMYHMIKNKTPDKQIIDYISQHRTTKEKAMSSSKRAIKNANIWIAFLKTLGEIPLVHKYLDIGANDGLITVEFGNRLGLLKENIYGIDVHAFTLQQIKPIDGFVFQYYDGCHVPFDNDSFDLITCSMVLHHVKCFDDLLKEIKRILKPNGLLLIKEHNADTLLMEWLILLEHILYDVMDYGITYEDFFKTYYQNLFSKNDLIKKLEKYDFKLIKTSDMSDKFVKKYQYYNPTNAYYALFRK